VLVVALLAPFLSASSAFALSATTNQAAASGNALVDLSWTNPTSPDFTDTRIYRRTSPLAAWTLVRTEPATDPTPEAWQDTGLTNTTGYWYAVRAYDGVGLVEQPTIVAGGIYGSYYDDLAFATYRGRSLDTKIDVPSGSTPPLLSSNSNDSMRWTGYVYTDYAETYTYWFNHDDPGRIWVDGVQIMNQATAGNHSATRAMTPGWHSLVVETEGGGVPNYATLSWSSPSQPLQVIPAAKLGHEAELYSIPTDIGVAVTSPNGGETVSTTTQSISWTRSGTDPISSYRVRLSSDGGATYPTLLAGVSGATTSYTWNVPSNTYGSQFRIRVDAVDANGDTMRSDASDADFTVSTSVPAPVTGVSAEAGSGQVTLRWSNPADPRFDHVQVWRSTTEGDPGVPVYTAPSSATTSWVDLGRVNGTTYYYTVRSADAGGTVYPSPSGMGLDASWFAGDLQTYLATSRYNSALAADWGSNVNVGPYPTGYPGWMSWDWFSVRWSGMFWAEQAGTYNFSTTMYDGARLWVDNSQLYQNWPGTDCNCSANGSVALTRGWHPIRLEYKDNSGTANQYTYVNGPGLSNQVVPLTLLSAEPTARATPTTDTIALASPNGAETFRGAAQMPISWTSTATVGSVVLRYSTDGGASYLRTIAASQPLNGSFDWSIPPNVQSSQVRVRAELRSSVTGEPTASDASDANLTVDTMDGGPLLPAPINLTASPSSGQVALTWTNPVPAGSFDHAVILRSTTERTPGQVVHVAAPGETSWTDTTITNGTNYYYRVRGSDGSGRLGRNIMPGEIRRSFYSGANLDTFRYTDTSTGPDNYDWGSDVNVGPWSGSYPGWMTWDWFSFRVNAYVYIDTAGDYKFDHNIYDTGGYDGSRIFVDGTPVVSTWPGANCNCHASGGIYLTNGWHEVVHEYQDADSTARTALRYEGPGVGRQVVPITKLGYEPMVQAQAQADAVTLTTPNGGEQWLGETTRTIAWTSTAATGSVMLRYSLDGGATYPYFIASGQPLSGSFDWNVPPSINSSQVRVEAELRSMTTGMPTISDTSDADLTIDTLPASLPPAPLDLAAKAGSSQVTVTWTSPTPIGTFDHAVIYRSTSERTDGSVVHVAAPGETTWVDTTTANGTNYFYRVRGADAVGHESRRVVPGEIRRSFYSGNNHDSFRFTDTSTSAVNYDWGSDVNVGPWSGLYPGWMTWDWFSYRINALVYIDTAGSWKFDHNWSDAYSNDGSRIYVDGTNVVNNWPNADCNCSGSGPIYLTVGWHEIVQEYQESTGNARVALRYEGPGVSRQVIPITKLGYEPIVQAQPSADTVTVTSPNGGEDFAGEAPVSIAWNSAAASGSVMLRYSLDGGVTYPYYIASAQPLSGSISWSIPSGLDSTQVRIMAELRQGASAFPSVSDSSDGNFTVDSTPGPLPPAPSGLAATPGDTQVALTWTNPSPIGTFDHAVIYRSTSERSVGQVVHTAAAGATSWTDTGTTDGTSYFYRVRGADAAGRQSRRVVPGEIRRSFYSGNNHDSFRYTDTSTSAINYDWGNDVNVGPWSGLYPGWNSSDWFSYRINALVYIDTAGSWKFDHNWADAYSNDGSRIYVDGTNVVNNWPNADCNCAGSGSIYLTVGWHEIVQEYQESTNYARVALRYEGPGVSRQVIPITKLGYEPIVQAQPSADTVTVTSPNGGEAWRGQPTKQLTWTSSASSGSILLRYSIDGGATYPYVIAAGLPTTGSLEWSVPPNVNSTQVRVQAELRSGTSGMPTVRDASDADFTIDSMPAALPPAPTNVATAPSNGQVVVTWDNPSPVGTFDHAVVYRSTSERLDGQPVFSAAPGATSWTDTSVSNGGTYYYRVRGVDAANRESRQIVPGTIRRSFYSGNNHDTYRFTDTSMSAINYDWGNASTSGIVSPEDMAPLTWDSFSYRINALVYIDTAGSWKFDHNWSDSYSNDGSRIYVDGTTVVNNWPNADCNCSGSGPIYLTVGWHEIVQEYQESSNYARVALRYEGPGVARQVIPIAKLGYEPISQARPSSALIAIDAPTDGSTLQGRTASIGWTTTNAPVGSYVRLRVSYDSGGTWSTIAGNALASPYTWQLPPTTNTPNARLRADLVDITGQVIATDTTANMTVDSASTGTVTGLTLTPGWNQIQVQWTNPATTNFDHVNIYRSTSTMTLGSKVQTVASPGSSWTDTSVFNGTTYYYTVRAADASDREQISVEAGRIHAAYWTGANFDGVLKGDVADTTSINYTWNAGYPAIVGQADSWSIRWTGWIYLDQTTTWTFDDDNSADGVRMWIGGTKIADQFNQCDCQVNHTVQMKLVQGWHPFTYEMQETTGWARTYFYYSRPGMGRQIVPMSALGSEVQRATSPTDTTPPVPNPNGTATPISATRIDWSAPGASDAMSGLNATAYSFDGGTTWQAADTYSRTTLTANTQYSQSVVVRDLAGNQTTPRVVSARTHAVAPSVTSDRTAGTWLGSAQATVTFSNNVAWGVGGVQYYRYVWDTSPTHAWSGTETVWNGATLPRTATSTGDWYLHLRSYNGDDVASAPGDVGPYRIDLDAPTPTPPTVATSSTTSSVTFTVSGAADVGSGLDASPYSFDGGATWQGSATYTATGLNPNDTISRTVLVRDAVLNVTSSTVATATTQPANPDVTGSPAADVTWRVNGTVVTLTSNVAFGPGTLWGYRYRISTNASDVVTGTDPAWTSGTLPVALGGGTNATWYIHVRSFNSDNVGGTTQAIGPYRIDASGPGPVTPVAGADPTNVAPALSWTSVTDGESGLALYRVYRSTTNGVLGSLVDTTTSTSFTEGDTLIDGQRYWYTVRGVDNLGNEQLAGNTQVGVTYDSITPLGSSVAIDGGAPSTNTTVVTLALSSTNAVQMKVGNLPDLSDATWEAFSATKGLTLAPGDGTKTAYARFRSANDSESATVSDTIVLDTTAPLPNPSTATAAVLSATQVTWTAGAASDAGAGLHASPYSFDGGTTWQATVDLVQGALAPNTAYTRQVRTRDVLGNQTSAGAVTATTLPSAPGISSVPAPDAVNTQPLGTTFEFTNDAGFGPGAVQYYRWAWDASPTHVFTGTEAMWSASTLSRQEWVGGTYYLHVKAYNSVDAGGQELTIGPYMLAPPTGSQTVHSNVASTQTLACATSDFTVDLLPGTQDDATIDCTVTSAVAGWNLQAHATAAPFFTGFLDASPTIGPYAGPAATDAQVAFTASGTYALAAFANGTSWRGFAGGTDITIGGDTGSTGATVVTNRIRADLGSSASVAPGPRSQTVTYTLSPGAPA
jgi:fibronectin type 3 domain-containing protein